MRMTKDLKIMPDSQRLKELNLFILTKKRVRDDWITTCQYQHGEQNSDNRGLVSLSEKGIIRFNDWKLKMD